MRIQANTKKVTILDEEKITSGAYNDIEIDIELSQEYNGLTTYITFGKQKIILIGNKVAIPTLPEGICRIGIYAIKIENDSTTLRYSPAPAYISVTKGSYKEGLEAPYIPSTQETDKIYNLIDKAIQEGRLKGEKGDKGDKGDTGPAGPKGDTPTLDYDMLLNKPSINGTTISSDKSAADYNLQSKLTSTQISNINSISSKVSSITIDGKNIVNNAVAKIPTIAGTEYGVIKSHSLYATSANKGSLMADTLTVTEYGKANSGAFISKGTMNNLLGSKIATMESIINMQKRVSVVNETSGNIILESNSEYRKGTLTEPLTFVFPSVLSYDYCSSVTFTQGEEVQNIIFDTSQCTKIQNQLKLKGDSCFNDQFIPNRNTRYNIIFYWDGEYMVGIVITI